MHGRPARGQLHTLDGLQGGTRRVFPAGVAIIGCANTSGRVDAGPPCLVGKADEMRIRKIILQHRQVRSLPVAEMQDVGALVVLEFLDGFFRRFQLCAGFTYFDHRLGVAILPNGFPVGRHRHHSRG